LLDFFLWCGSLKDRRFVLLLVFVLVFDFSPDEMEDIGLPPEKVRVAKNVFAGVFAAFVEAVHIELPDEGVDVPVPEVLGEDMVLELVDLFDGKLASVGHPVDDGLVLFVLEDLEALLDEVSDRIICNLT
jgi:hypothetical protein